MSELLRCLEITKGDTFVHLMVERDFIERLLKVPPDQLIVHEGLSRQEIEVLLQALADEVALEAAEEFRSALLELALEEGEHAPGDGDEREVLLFLEVLLADE